MFFALLCGTAIWIDAKALQKQIVVRRDIPEGNHGNLGYVTPGDKQAKS
jgi:hypothetical protein